MIYLKTKDPNNGITTEKLLYCWGDVFRETFSPEIAETAVIIEFKTHGKTYKERRENLHNLAVNFSNACTGDLYYSDVESIIGWFEKNSKQYGLTREFRGNGII